MELPNVLFCLFFPTANGLKDQLGFTGQPGWWVKYHDTASGVGVKYVNINVLIETRGVSYWAAKCYANGGTTVLLTPADGSLVCGVSQ